MACFLVSMTEAMVTELYKKILKKSAQPCCQQTAKTEQADTEQSTESVSKIPFSRKLGWLSKMLWPHLLAIEHIWHRDRALAAVFRLQ